MKQRAYTVRLYEYDQLEELTEEQVLLVNSAIKAARDAYAPYSQYHVGAALRLANGEIVIGSNQENAAYPSGLCAERVAIFYAGARHPDVPVHSIAIAAIREGIVQEEPVAPCGACRQVISDLCGNIDIVLVNSKNETKVMKTSELLPFAFGDKDLK